MSQRFMMERTMYNNLTEDELLNMIYRNYPILSNIALKILKIRLYNEFWGFTYDDLMSIIETRDGVFSCVANEVLDKKYKESCLGCLYDKCDQESHMGTNGCLE